jgi:hypothetical protein
VRFHFSDAFFLSPYAAYLALAIALLRQRMSQEKWFLGKKTRDGVSLCASQRFKHQIGSMPSALSLG